MNTFWDLVNSWSEKFTLRILRFSGVSEAGIKKATEAFKSKDAQVIESDKELRNKVPWLKYTFYAGLVLLGVVLYKRIADPRRRRRY
jgi:hypothetical protein